VRIIGGTHKRRLIRFPSSRQTRPMTDRAKETIFNILGDLSYNAAVLDLYAGSGSLGLEAMSRGAREVSFVESGREALQCIRENLQTLKLSNNVELLQLSVFDALKRIENDAKKYDLIFLDPPHNKGLIKKTLHQIDRSDIVRPSGIVVVGHSNKEGLPEVFLTLYFQRSVKIGQTFMSFLIRKA
jgi:16S rRNA (guanine966-N2)-methyltransferase